MLCNYRSCQEIAAEEPTVVEVKGQPTRTIFFCIWHQEEFEIYSNKREQLNILRYHLKHAALPAPAKFDPPVTLEDVLKVKESVNLGTGKVTKLEEDDDIPF